MEKIIRFLNMHYLYRTYGISSIVLFLFVTFSMIVMGWDDIDNDIYLVMAGETICYDKVYWVEIKYWPKCISELEGIIEAFWYVVLANIIYQTIFYILFWPIDRLYGAFKNRKKKFV